MASQTRSARSRSINCSRGSSQCSQAASRTAVSTHGGASRRVARLIAMRTATCRSHPANRSGSRSCPIRSQNVQEHVLGKLEGVAGVSEPPQRDGVHGRLELLDQRPERLAVSPLSAPDGERQISPGIVLSLEFSRSDQHVTHLPLFGVLRFLPSRAANLAAAKQEEPGDLHDRRDAGAFGIAVSRLFHREANSRGENSAFKGTAIRDAAANETARARWPDRDRSLSVRIRASRAKPIGENPCSSLALRPPTLTGESRLPKQSRGSLSSQRAYRNTSRNRAIGTHFPEAAGIVAATSLVARRPAGLGPRFPGFFSPKRRCDPSRSSFRSALPERSIGNGFRGLWLAVQVDRRGLRASGRNRPERQPRNRACFDVTQLNRRC